MNNYKTILIVDDRMDNCLILKEIFEDIGFSVDIACNRLEVSSLVEKNSYKIALIDLFLKHSDGGIDVIKQIKERYPGTRLFMMTGYQMEKELEEAFTAGVSKVFIKPFDMAEMIKTFEEIK